VGVAGGDEGWLVFEPNYRGSVGYGDQFTLGIVPNIVSKPGKDILEGVEALVKDGIADPDNLTIGGYSYGGYMTNWLITQTTGSGRRLPARARWSTSPIGATTTPLTTTLTFWAACRGT
jgi:dienelactone hydrolase